MSTGYVYILECSDGTFYTGSTRDLERRVQQHQAGDGVATFWWTVREALSCSRR